MVRVVILTSPQKKWTRKHVKNWRTLTREARKITKLFLERGSTKKTTSMPFATAKPSHRYKRLTNSTQLWSHTLNGWRHLILLRRATRITANHHTTRTQSQIVTKLTTIGKLTPFSRVHNNITKMTRSSEIKWLINESTDSKSINYMKYYCGRSSHTYK